ncbi:T9SS sorting signal type C domain-containing protein [Flavobacterium sp. NRK1]|uniref:T9SS sorting signal type C domain-containing protein n=1 Tax=Flavobacterium sp. NRK1 TaxID=2954929 RepID=UPI002092ECEB|nr:T9SS sorting signal type C domain-containing protein [Flavobacterium sp. NRK1]MCO6147822.1 T9SS sorting signal type C domain-containing protein [Flavobacterium sp. NRK1]
MTTLFYQLSIIAKKHLYLLFLLPFYMHSQNPGSYCDTHTTWNGMFWTNGEPTAEKDAIISSDYTYTNGTFTACSLFVTGGAHVNFSQNSNAVIVHNVHVANNSELVFESGSNLIQTEGQENTGNVTIKRNSSLIKKDDFTLWSSPVSGQVLLDFSPETMINRFYTFFTFDNVYNLISDPAATTFQNAKGYLIRTEETHPTTPSIWEGSFSGTPNTGDISIPLDYINSNLSYNSVGNPYPSPINIAKFIDANSDVITGTLWLWRKTDDPGKSSYCVITKFGYQSNTIPDPENNTIQDPFELHEEGILNTGQGFMVKSTCSQNLVFNNSMREMVNSESFFRTISQKDDEEVNASRFWLDVTAEGVFTQALIGYSSIASNEFDNGWDGETILDGGVTLYSISETSKLAIQARQEFDTTDIVKLGFKTNVAGTYQLALDHMDGIFANGQHVYIKDHTNGSINNLNAGPYTFISEAGTFEDRFEVVYDTTAGLTNSQSENADIYSDNHQITINASESIKSVIVYDIAGKKIYEQNNIELQKYVTDILNVQQVVIVNITLTNGVIITKKILVQ